MSSRIDPPRAPLHRCINAACGCTDLVSAGPCSRWCTDHTLEVTAVEHGAALGRCECGHDVCVANMPAQRGFVTASERGVG